MGPLGVIPRTQWAKAGPDRRKINPMGPVRRITVHHEGSTAVWFSDLPTSSLRLELIRQQHMSRGWADIGYHFIVDRAGRVWQGRDLWFQGAHVRGNNEHNIGIMMLGNFDIQYPSHAQTPALCRVLSLLMRQYRVPVSRIFTHQEIVPTACPGKALQPRMVALRSGRYLL